MTSLEHKIKYCCSDLYKFYRLFITSIYSNNCPAPHIRTLSRELMKIARGNYHRICVAMPPRHKLADSTPILTSNRGWTTHGDLKIGDYVYGLNGEPTKIIGISDKSNCNQLITFSNGSKILAHEEHLWTVSKRGNKNPLTITTSEIKKDYQYTEKNGKKRYRYHLPFIKPIQYEKTELPLDPYFLGLWLGDGSSTKPCITHDPKDIESIEHIPYKISTICTHTETGVKTTYFSHQGIIKKIKELQEQNSLLYLTLQSQVNTVERASKYEKERKSIMCENRELKEKCENMENDYSTKLKEEIRKVENKYEDKIYKLEKENSFLRKIINTLQKTVDKFIHWVCNKFSVSSEDEFIKDFEFENDIYLDPEKQIEYEEELEDKYEM